MVGPMKHWERLIAWGNKHFAGRLGVNAGASAADIAGAEKLFGKKLPEDFKAFYRQHDGQGDDAVGLIYGQPFLPLALISEDFSALRDDSEAEKFGEDEIHPADEGKIKSGAFTGAWIPFTNDWAGNHFALDLDPGAKGTYGQVINFGRDQGELFVVAKSFNDFLAWLIELYEAGNFELVKDGDQAIFFNPQDPPGCDIFSALPEMKLPSRKF
ncbi:MAG: beta-1 3-glucan biosynthesis protein [Proteobacteria bacterium]|nr:MAG: beta-1 3-glucan biosynthesis protein [Pseudomonadota bacterium]